MKKELPNRTQVAVYGVGTAAFLTTAAYLLYKEQQKTKENASEKRKQKQKAEQERKAASEERKQKQKAEQERKAASEKRKQKQKAEQERKAASEERKQKQKDEQERKAASEERKRKEEEERKRKEAEEHKRKEEEDRKRKEEEERKRKEAEERKRKEEEDRKRKEEEERKKREEDERKRKEAEERKKKEEEERKRKEEERKKREEEERKRKEEEERKRKEREERIKKKRELVEKFQAQGVGKQLLEAQENISSQTLRRDIVTYGPLVPFYSWLGWKAGFASYQSLIYSWNLFLQKCYALNKTLDAMTKYAVLVQAVPPKTLTSYKFILKPEIYLNTKEKRRDFIDLQKTKAAKQTARNLTNAIYKSGVDTLPFSLVWKNKDMPRFVQIFFAYNYKFSKDIKQETCNIKYEAGAFNFLVHLYHFGVCNCLCAANLIQQLAFTFPDPENVVMSVSITRHVYIVVYNKRLKQYAKFEPTGFRHLQWGGFKFPEFPKGGFGKEQNETPGIIRVSPESVFAGALQFTEYKPEIVRDINRPLQTLKHFLWKPLPNISTVEKDEAKLYLQEVGDKVTVSRFDVISSALQATFGKMKASDAQLAEFAATYKVPPSFESLLAQKTEIQVEKLFKSAQDNVKSNYWRFLELYVLPPLPKK